MTIREIAEIAGVSPSTVSNVINNKKNVSEETRERILSIIKENNYEIKKRKIEEERTSIVFLKYRTHGMAVNQNQGFIASIVDSIQKECSRFNFDLQIVNANPRNIDLVIDYINKSKTPGVIFLATEYLTGKDNFIKNIEVPMVVLDNSLRKEEFDSVLMDNRRISIQSVKYLYELGHRKIGYVKSSLEIDNLTERYVGYKEAMDSFGLEALKPIEVTPTFSDAYKELSENFHKINRKKYDALVCNFDILALATLRVLKENKIKVPEDISIIGVDDIAYSSMVVPSLTTIKISREALAYYVVDQLVKRIEGLSTPHVTIKVMGELVIRESTEKGKKC